jgi:DNA-binding transcriptional ArsR family regulator
MDARAMSDLARLASLIADPTRARILTALMGGTASTATELATEAGIAPSTASSHLAKLTAARLLAIEKQGRHRYFRLYDEDIAEMLEGLMGIASRPEPRHRTGPSDPALRAARVCYDHLAGERGVWLFAQLRRRNVLEPSAHARTFFAPLGIDVDALSNARRPLTRTCLDWSERRPHLAGSLGAAILARVFTLRWARRELDGRAVIFSPSGERAFRAHFER